MSEYLKKHRVLIIAFIVFICAAAALSQYRASRLNILKKSEFNSFVKEMKQASDAGVFSSQEALSDYIRTWADNKQLEYKEDKAGNLVFVQKAVDRKKNLSPTVICVSCNYETVKDNLRLIASAAMIAGTELNSGRKTVVFVNDEQNSGKGYQYLSKKLFSRKAKVIYMDYGSSSYMSNSSFGKKYSEIRIKAGQSEPVCDSAVRIHISVPESVVVGTGISRHPDAIAAFSTLLTRLKSRSAICQVADLEIGTNGSMTPVSLDAVIMLNSYALPSFTKYIDKRIKAWDKAYSGDYPDISYTYEIIEDDEDLPEKAYSRSATARLTNVLYTLKTGIYIYEDSESIPEGRKSGDIFGINAITGIRPEDNSICIDLMTQAYDDEYMQRIMDDNTAAAELFNCTLRETDDIQRFLNEKDALYRTFRTTFSKVNGISGAGSLLTLQTDNYFTPCSYLAAKNKNADVIHLRLNSEQAHIITNSILCYIAYKGNMLL